MSLCAVFPSKSQYNCGNQSENAAQLLMRTRLTVPRFSAEKRKPFGVGGSSLEEPPSHSEATKALRFSPRERFEGKPRRLQNLSPAFLVPKIGVHSNA